MYRVRYAVRYSSLQLQLRSILGYLGVSRSRCMFILVTSIFSGNGVTWKSFDSNQRKGGSPCHLIGSHRGPKGGRQGGGDPNPGGSGLGEGPKSLWRSSLGGGEGPNPGGGGGGGPQPRSMVVQIPNLKGIQLVGGCS